MTGHRKGLAAFVAAGLIAGGYAVYAQTAATQTQPAGAQSPGSSRLPLAPLGRSGNAIIPAQEGWWRNDDGTTTFLIGYFNRNDASIEIPLGPNNRMEPGGPDMNQPTVFLPRRQHGVFTITVPKDFGNKRITWTLTANGQPVSVPFWINTPYVVDPFRNAANGNTPPRVRFAVDGPESVAGPRGIAASYEASVNVPLPLALWFRDAGETVAHAEGEPARPNNIRVSWWKHRGPGAVTFDPATQTLTQPEGTASATATFSVPGTYVLRAQVNDGSGEGGGGDQCCWTNAHVKVTVKP